ncbi:hypothetical protein Egran_00818 [Elaphomyces granulatus]|uniref:Fatty acid desaturase domain-containing protein n=1 Tax=Elaphomyces granulatus TaxID=519963 RepID=A0A232M4R3_9EURO|nr:hypothetical protein Egran_00818 [Elaphomyces granulatus]
MVDTFVNPRLTLPDILVLKNLLGGIDHQRSQYQPSDCGREPSDAGVLDRGNDRFTQEDDNDEATVAALQALNNPRDGNFDPTVFALWDLKDMSGTVKWMLRPYIQWAQQAVRHPTDVIILTHLILYFLTSVPSAIYLFREFTWLHGVAHWIMQTYYVGTYTLLKHQHIHMGGVLAKRFPYNYIDVLFPYITDPLMGHTWNSYYYHHVKHHHVEGNGPDDLSSTIRYQRDDIFHLLHYIVKFLFLIWLDLPLYFIKKRKFDQAFKAAFWEVINFTANILLARWRFRPTLFVFILPLLLLRLGLMVGNWGQHAFVDDTEPDSDYRSSITLIDVASNRFCFNDGYHTSHHLNPRRHWRDHPSSFIKQKQQYASQRALVFRNIDYIMITVRLMWKDYQYLARCLVPIGDQIQMTMKEKEAMLRSKTQRFTEDDIKALFKK